MARHILEDARLTNEENRTGGCRRSMTGPLAYLADPNYQVDNGRAEIKNRTLRDLGQDLYDGLAPRQGGWLTDAATLVPMLPMAGPLRRWVA